MRGLMDEHRVEAYTGKRDVHYLRSLNSILIAHKGVRVVLGDFGLESQAA